MHQLIQRKGDQKHSWYPMCIRVLRAQQVQFNEFHVGWRGAQVTRKVVFLTLLVGGGKAWPWFLSKDQPRTSGDIYIHPALDVTLL